MAQIKMSNSWHNLLEKELKTASMKKLKLFLKEQSAEKKIIYPAQLNYFRALDLVEIQNTKVVILGQDPYHGTGQAHGLCFSVPDGIRPPPSLQNIFKELKSDLQVEIPQTGNLTRWAEQGVLLLNCVLTVEKDKAASHQNKGWEELTDKIISLVNENCEHVVFILWGSYAQKKMAFVDQKKHLVIANAHPSPLSSYRGFFGSKPFSKANKWLTKKGKKEISW